MRILFLTNYYPPHEVGGYEQLCRDVALALTDRGHTIAILTSDRGVKKEEDSVEPGIYRLFRIQPQYGVRSSPAAQFFLTRQATEAHNRRMFEQVVAQFRPDVVFVWNLEGLPHELALDAEAWPGVAVAYWLAMYTPAEPDAFWQYWMQPAQRGGFRQSIKNRLRLAAQYQMRREGKPVRPQMRHVAVVSEYMRCRGLAENTLPAHAEVIYNGVETDKFYRPVPGPDALPPINLLLAGRVSPDKGIHVAVEAVGRLAQSRSQRDFRLLVAGTGPADYVQGLKQLTADLGVGQIVSFLGWLPREYMPDLLHTCHILLLSAIHPEAFARVVLEGMAAGLAVVGTLTGGTSEILQDENTGLTCATADSQQMARQIQRLLDDPGLRHCLACRGQRMVLADYTLERMVGRVQALLERAVTEQLG